MKSSISRRGRSVWIHYFFDKEESKMISMVPEAVFDGVEIHERYVLPDEEKAKRFFNRFKKVFKEIPGLYSTYPKSQDLLRELVGKLEKGGT
jgi:hypothetical protein